MTSPALLAFGKAVLRARTSMGWTLEQTAHEVLGNQERKSYVSAVEKGRKNLSALTIQKFARCLDLPDAVMDPLLGGAPAADDPATQVEANADRLGAEVEDLRAQLKLSEALAVALAYEFAEGNPTDLESALRELRRAFEVAAEQKARGALPSNTDAAVDEIIAEVDRLNEAGAVEEAGAVLARALEAARDEAERADAKRRRLIEAGISQAVLERSVDSAVALEMERWRLDGGGFEALRNVQDVWYERGRDKGLRFDLEVAIALAPATEDYAANSDQRGTVRNDRGNALQTLGERETGTARLEEALAAYRGALEERTRDRVPLDWAATQNNLGSALQTLGKRESGTARLEEAVAAFRAALEEWTRELVPLDWAMTKNNLGNALATLGQRETSTARLEEAVQAYHDALEERTRDRVPLKWAMSQNNLGNALLTLGQREIGTARLEEAVQAYRAALEERTRDRVPLDWAATQNNLGNALRNLGEREIGAARLEESVVAYRAALEERTRDRVPLNWAGTSYILGYTEALLGERLGDIGQVDEGLSRIKSAIPVLEAGGHDLWAGYAHNVLADAAAIRDRMAGATG